MLADDFHRVGGIMGSGAIDIIARNAEARIIANRELKHRQAMVDWKTDFTLLDWVIGHWHEEDMVHVEAFAAVFGQNQMPHLRRIKAAAQDANALRAQSDHSSSNSPMNTVSPLRTPAFSSASTTPKTSSVLWKRSTASS